MTFRPYADNVVIELLPLESQTASGIQLAWDGKAKARGHRFARVVASGPGYWLRLQNKDAQGLQKTFRDVFIPNEVKQGETVLVDALAGQDYAMDVTIPRHNKSNEFQELFGDRGEFRIIREQEILGVVEQ